MSDSPTPWTASGAKLDELWEAQEDRPMIDQVPDMLATIFSQQRRLMHAVWNKELDSGLSVATREREWGDMTNRRVQGRIHETFGHLVRELSEAMAHLDGSKSWKDKPRETNVPEFREEIADALHFFVEFCILAGVDAESLFTEYFAKAITNTNRVKNGY